MIRTRDQTDSVFSRHLLLAWAGWLLGSWAVNLWIDSPSPMSTISLVSIVRGMLQSILIGLVIVWPAWRLSKPRQRDAGTETAADMFLMLLVSQTIVWAMRMIVGWSVIQTATVIATIVVTGAAAAQMTWWGRLARTGSGRALALVGCALILGGGWLWTWVTGQPVEPHWSPMATLWHWADPGHTHAGLARFGAQLAGVSGTTAAAWAVTRIVRSRHGREAASDETHRVNG